MNPSQAYEKYKHLDPELSSTPITQDLWQIVKQEAMKKVSILEVTLNGELIYSSKEGAK